MMQKIVEDFQQRDKIRFSLRFTVANTPDELALFKVVFVRTLNAKNELCINEYAGPKYVVLNQKLKQFAPYDYHHEANDRFLNLEHVLDFHNLERESFRNYLRLNCSKPDQLIDYRKLVRVQQEEGSYRIYCYKFNLLVGGHRMTCPNAVFKYPLSNLTVVDDADHQIKHLAGEVVQATNTIDFLPADCHSSQFLSPPG